MTFAFTEAEHRERIERARKTLRENGIDGAICVAPEHMFYFGGYDAHTQFSEQALVFSAGSDEPTIVMRDADVACATETSWVKDVRLYHYGAHRSESAAPLIADVLREKGLLGKRVSLEFEAYALTGGFLERIRASIGDTELVDGTKILGWLRVIKSPSELAYIREAQKHNLAGVKAAYESLRPGITEIEWAGEIQHALHRSGSEYSAMPVFIWSGERTALGHSMATPRVLQANEPVMFCFAGVTRRYHISTYHSAHLGPPSRRFQSLYDAAQEAQQALVGGVKVGAAVGEAARAANAVLVKHGLAEHMYVRWGYGVGIGYPPAWLEPLDVTPDAKEPWQPGMVFCLHVELNLPGEGIGLVSGGDYLLNPDGIEALDTTGGGPEKRPLVVL